MVKTLRLYVATLEDKLMKEGTAISETSRAEEANLADMKRSFVANVKLGEESLFKEAEDLGNSSRFQEDLIAFKGNRGA